MQIVLEIKVNNKKAIQNKIIHTKYEGKPYENNIKQTMWKSGCEWWNNNWKHKIKMPKGL